MNTEGFSADEDSHESSLGREDLEKHDLDKHDLAYGVSRQGRGPAASAERWPLSRLYHENSKLSPRRDDLFQEEVAHYAQDLERLRASTEACKDYGARASIDLPRDGRRWSGRRLRDVLATRRTRRGESVARPLRLEQWGALLGAACGVTAEIRHPEEPSLRQALRAWPSGGGLYPIEVYAAPLLGDSPPPAFYHFDARNRKLWCAAEAVKSELAEVIYADGLWEQAASLIVLTAVFARTQEKYGERGYRFVLMDAGHLAQNLLLCCEDLELNAIPLGGFDDDRLARMMGLDFLEEAPLYAILISPAR